MQAPTRNPAAPPAPLPQSTADFPDMSLPLPSPTRPMTPARVPRGPWGPLVAAGVDALAAPCSVVRVQGTAVLRDGDRLLLAHALAGTLACAACAYLPTLGAMVLLLVLGSGIAVLDGRKGVFSGAAGREIAYNIVGFGAAPAEGGAGDVPQLVIAAPLDSPATRRDASGLAARAGLVASLVGLIGAALALGGMLDVAGYLLLPAGGLFSVLALVAAAARLVRGSPPHAPRPAADGGAGTLSDAAVVLAAAAARIHQRPAGRIAVSFVMLGGVGFTGDALVAALQGNRHLLPAASTRVVVLTELGGPARHVRAGGRLRPVPADPLLLEAADALRLPGERRPSAADAGNRAGWRSMAVAGRWSPDGLVELVERLERSVAAGRW